MKSSDTRQAVVNQLLNFFWTILCFAPVIYFWWLAGIHLNFYLFLIISAIIGIIPQKKLDFFLLSHNRKFYEKIGVKYIRKFVQNGDFAAAMSGSRTNHLIKTTSQAGQYLKTIDMYERYHWICFCFFFLTTIYCFSSGYLKLGFVLVVANLLYNISSILLQQYNKIRIRKIIE
ncbi:MAG TPA: hypothetical protein VMI12_00975 [Puia sp.]|nr:hypothetical protein [Puia sp.]